MEFGNAKCKKVKPDTEAVFISSRIRLARNIAGEFFSTSNSAKERKTILNNCVEAIGKVRKFSTGRFLNLEELTPSDREILVERNMISRELAAGDGARGAYVSADCSSCVMINEEDHLRIQVLERGLCLDSLWKKIDSLDNQIEKKLPYSFSDRFGYLTACPTNTGTGMRASVMMHLLGLTMSGQMDAVIRGLNHLGMVARGSNGEGSNSSGGFYQISNQQTLGSTELDIVEKMTKMCVKIGEFELNARQKLLEDSPELVFDKISRAWAVLDSCRIIGSAEALECLSALRLAADMGFMPAKSKIVIDSMLLEVRPAHLERDFGREDMSPQARDILRAKVLKESLVSIKKPSFPKTKKSSK